MSLEVLQGSLDNFAIIKSHEKFINTHEPITKYTNRDGRPSPLSPSKRFQKSKLKHGKFFTEYMTRSERQEVRLLCYGKESIISGTDFIKVTQSESINGFVIPESLEFAMRKLGGEWLSANFIIKTEDGTRLKFTVRK